MAYIRKRKNSYSVVYRVKNVEGIEHQKSESYATQKEAEKRKKEITDSTVNTDERSLRDNVKDENESGYVELPTEKHESEPVDIAKNTGHNVLTSGKAKSIEPGSGDNNNKIKEDSFGLQDNKTMITSHTDEHPDIANSIKSYSDEDDFDEFLDEMTEQY